MSGQGIKFTETAGFKGGNASVHTGCTMMLAELRLLLDHVAVDASVHDYVRSVVDENILGKSTRTSHQETMQRLRDLYGVDSSCTLFRLLRHYLGGNGQKSSDVGLSCRFCAQSFPAGHDAFYTGNSLGSVSSINRYCPGIGGEISIAIQYEYFTVDCTKPCLDVVAGRVFAWAQ